MSTGCRAIPFIIDDHFRSLFPNLKGDKYFVGEDWATGRITVLDGKFQAVPAEDMDISVMSWEEVRKLRTGAEVEYCSHPLNMLF